MKRIPLLLLVAIAAGAPFLLGGCASTAGIAPAAKPIAPASVGLGEGESAPEIAPDWWRAFDDAQLDRLVERALAGTPTLRMAQARLAAARAGVDSAHANAGPQLNGTADATREKFSANGIFPPPLGGTTQTLLNGQLGGSWELDFFGRNRAAIEAAVGTERAAQADVQAARILLASNVARTYVQLGRLFAQRDVAARALAQREQVLSLIRQRVQGGLDTNVDLRQGEGALPEARQQIEAFDEQIGLTRHALAALTAQAPDALDGLMVRLSSVQTVALPAVVPADLIGRRADITAARWRIEAAAGAMKGARAQFYPDVNLTAFIGLSSIGFGQFFRSDSAQLGAGPAIRLPIFDAGRLRANLRGKAADLDAAIESYNNAVLEAVRDAADQIGSLRSVGVQQAEQARAQAAAESAYDLATQRYKAGLSTYLTVLTAESTVLAQRRQAADLEARALDTQIALIRALGGGYARDTRLGACNPSKTGEMS